MSASAARSLPPRNPPGACRHAALAVRRDLGSAVPHPGLRLRQRRAGRARASRARSRAFSIRASPIPTVAMFEERMAAFEGAEAARATATGMAAVTLALIGQLKAGDHVVAAKALFGSCRYVVEDFLPRFGVASTLVDGTDLDAWRDAVRPNTKTFFLESPTNPTLDVIDIAAVAKIAHAAGATLVVDNVFATPLFQSAARARRRLRGLFGDQAYRRPGPLPRRHHPRLGEVHPEATSICCCARPGRRCRRSMPGCCSRAWRRCAVRVRRQTDSAATLAAALAEHPKDHAADLSGPARPSAGRRGAEADARRLDAGRLRDRGRQERRRSAFRTRSSSCASATISATPRA